MGVVSYRGTTITGVDTVKLLSSGNFYIYGNTGSLTTEIICEAPKRTRVIGKVTCDRLSVTDVIFNGDVGDLIAHHVVNTYRLNAKHIPKLYDVSWSKTSLKEYTLQIQELFCNECDLSEFNHPDIFKLSGSFETLEFGNISTLTGYNQKYTFFPQVELEGQVKNLRCSCAIINGVWGSLKMGSGGEVFLYN